MGIYYLWYNLRPSPILSLAGNWGRGVGVGGVNFRRAKKIGPAR